MAKTAIRAGIDQPLNVHGKRFSEITFDLVLLLNDLADLHNLIFTEILHASRAIDPGLIQDVARRGPPDPEYIGQANVRPLLPRQIHSSDACHNSSYLFVYVFNGRGWVSLDCAHRTSAVSSRAFGEYGGSPVPCRPTTPAVVYAVGSRRESAPLHGVSLLCTSHKSA